MVRLQVGRYRGEKHSVYSTNSKGRCLKSNCPTLICCCVLPNLFADPLYGGAGGASACGRLTKVDTYQLYKSSHSIIRSELITTSVSLRLFMVVQNTFHLVCVWFEC